MTKSFNCDKAEVRAVDNVNLRVQRGEFVLIFGRSGSGKSTLLGLLAGLIRPSSGKITINGLNIIDLAEKELSILRAKEIGFVFQFSGLIPTITALQNVLLPTLFYPAGSGNRSRSSELLEKLGILDRANAYPCTLSSGEMKRVAIARALINSPSILIADEPTGDLDVETELEIMELFRQLNDEGTTIVMVTHNPDLAPYATRIHAMVKGRLYDRNSELSYRT